MQTGKCSETEVSQDFHTLLKLTTDAKHDGDVKLQENKAPLDNHSVNDEEEENEDEEEEDEDEEEEEEFSFMCGGANTSPIAAEDAFINGQIKPIFPLFNRDLLFSGEDLGDLRENLPMRVQVKKVFVETTGSNPEDDGGAGPSCDWSNRKAVEASPEVCKKSNSTGFSKLWRFKDLLGRSNSDGRDAFVFLNNSHAPAENPAPPSAAKVEEKSERKESAVATVKATGKARKSVGKGKTALLSAHEAYLKSKAKEGERRRSYLPYRPELMGFFTNVNGGLSKNVHPF